jgi:cysteinyl-tRNA synthetase
MLQAHYRSILDFSDDLLQPKRIQKTNGGSSHVKKAKRKTVSTIDIATWKQSCYDAMNDDFNSILIAQLFEGVL